MYLLKISKISRKGYNLNVVKVLYFNIEIIYLRFFGQGYEMG